MLRAAAASSFLGGATPSFTILVAWARDLIGDSIRVPAFNSKSEETADASGDFCINPNLGLSAPSLGPSFSNLLKSAKCSGVAF